MQRRCNAAVLQVMTFCVKEPNCAHLNVSMPLAGVALACPQGQFTVEGGCYGSHFVPAKCCPCGVAPFDVFSSGEFRCFGCADYSLDLPDLLHAVAEQFLNCVFNSI